MRPIKTVHMKIIFAKNIKKIVVFAAAGSLLAMAGCGSADSAPDYLTADSGQVASSSDNSSKTNASTNKPSTDESSTQGENSQNQAWEKQLVYHVGQENLPPATAPNYDNPITYHFQVDEPVWVTGFTPKVVDASGKELPGELLHQAIAINLHEDNELCGGGGGNPFFMATSMLTALELPKGFGYAILPTDPIEIDVIFENKGDKGYSDVTFELTLDARSMDEFTQAKDVKPILVEPDPCQHAPLKIEPGEFSEKSSSYAIATPGKVVAAQGALQDYGAAIDLTAGKSQTPFWHSEALLDASHHLTALTDNPFTDPDGVSIKQGDELKLGVTYNNTSNEWLNSATAGAMVYISPDE